MPRLDSYFRETATGLRRNGIVAFAAMSTAFIALFLLGLALLIAREVGLVIEVQTGNVEVAVYLTDPKPDTVARLTEKLVGLDAVESVAFWDHAKTCEEFNLLFQDEEALRENVDCEKVIPTSLRVHLADPKAGFDQVTSALDCGNDDQGKLTCAEPGILNVADYRQVLKRLVAITHSLSVGVLFISIIMLVAAVLLVANTLRMGMFARRKEIGIMRLVGATNWRIRTPFLIEALVESLIGAAAAIVALFFVEVVFFDRLRGQFRGIPVIRNADVLATAPWIALAAILVAIVAGTVGMRRFLDV